MIKSGDRVYDTKTQRFGIVRRWSQNSAEIELVGGYIVWCGPESMKTDFVRIGEN